MHRRNDSFFFEIHRQFLFLVENHLLCVDEMTVFFKKIVHRRKKGEEFIKFITVKKRW